VTGELEALVAEYPLREGLYALLMLALYRSGRQAEALQTHKAARRTLVDELGIEPGRALQDLHRAVLRQDPGLDLDPIPQTGGGEQTGRSILVVRVATPPSCRSSRSPSRSRIDHPAS
jgi:DNA-binding SARP family transcriptional activator